MAIPPTNYNIDFDRQALNLRRQRYTRIPYIKRDEKNKQSHQQIKIQINDLKTPLTSIKLKPISYVTILTYHDRTKHPIIQAQLH